ncbi:MAG: 50S ribosomal protein L13 [Patescibacteria group bacterium]|nr:50S ribosomal protein L13 [Patescibacteria group bacterium]
MELKKPVQKIKNKPEIKTHTIDASGKILGRLATVIAVILRGKDKPSFQPYLVMGDKVLVLNASKIKVTGGKETKKMYYSHSGYLGHLKTSSYNDIFKKNPGEVLKRAVWGMLPKNKLRKIWIKNLEIRNEN